MINQQEAPYKSISYLFVGRLLLLFSFNLSLTASISTENENMVINDHLIIIENQVLRCVVGEHVNSFHCYDVTVHGDFDGSRIIIITIV